MSRNLIPVVMAIGVGVFTGYYTFQPTLQQLAAEKSPGIQSSNPTSASDKPAGALNAGPLTTKPEAEKTQ